ncbi:hypothetical protein X769_16225 [Mesorhizobium sp. LSJC268A00]|nr:hypothetical protein X769_16225 [Mesorhizobium sp. LSJC268A00]
MPTAVAVTEPEPSATSPELAVAVAPLPSATLPARPAAPAVEPLPSATEPCPTALLLLPMATAPAAWFAAVAVAVPSLLAMLLAPPVKAPVPLA